MEGASAMRMVSYEPMVTASLRMLLSAVFRKHIVTDTAVRVQHGFSVRLEIFGLRSSFTTRTLAGGSIALVSYRS